MSTFISALRVRTWDKKLETDGVTSPVGLSAVPKWKPGIRVSVKEADPADAAAAATMFTIVSAHVLIINRKVALFENTFPESDLLVECVSVSHAKSVLSTCPFVPGLFDAGFPMLHEPPVVYYLLLDLPTRMLRFLPAV